jgi:predicted type IV restriction endonuclease
MTILRKIKAIHSSNKWKKNAMESEQAIERISRLQKGEIGPTEENVKQKIIVPLLELLGHKRESLEFEYRTRRGGKMDIFIKNVPSDCKVIIDTKNYSENLNDHIEQIKEYAFDEAALLKLIANGNEIRIYSPLRGISFEKSLLYSIHRKDLTKESVWNTISELLHNDNLLNRNVFRKISEREREIREAMISEERFNKELESKTEAIDSDIEKKEEEIDQLTKEKERLIKNIENRISQIWGSIGLPIDLYRVPLPTLQTRTTDRVKVDFGARKAGRVTLQELVNHGLLKNRQTLYFYHTRTFEDERAEVVAPPNQVIYKLDGRNYSVSKLAEKLLKKHAFKHDDHGVAGPRYWVTKDGILLNSLNEQIRKKRGDRR